MFVALSKTLLLFDVITHLLLCFSLCLCCCDSTPTESNLGKESVCWAYTL